MVLHLLTNSTLIHERGGPLSNTLQVKDMIAFVTVPGGIIGHDCGAAHRTLV